LDDVIDIVQEEASEDIFRMAGSDAPRLERRSPRQVRMLRLPWVLLTLLIEMMAGVVIHFSTRRWARSSCSLLHAGDPGDLGQYGASVRDHDRARSGHGPGQLVRGEPLWRQIRRR